MTGIVYETILKQKFENNTKFCDGIKVYQFPNKKATERSGVMQSYDIYAKYRDALGMRDADVAKAAHVGKSMLSEWKHGAYKPKIDKLMRIASVLGVSPMELFQD